MHSVKGDDPMTHPNTPPPPAHTAGRLTPAERETLLALRDGPIYPNRGESWPVLVMLDNHGLAEEIDGTFVLTDAGRAALAAQAEPTRPADAPDPAAWAALAKGFPEVSPRGLYDDDEPEGYLESDRDFVANNLAAAVWFLEHAAAIRAAIAQAEGQEGGSCVN